MRVETLEHFLEVVRSGSFSRAAQQLYISQQGLSNSIRTLEKELGVELFERTGGKKAHLTEAGKTLINLAEQCVDAHKQIKRSMQSCMNQNKDTSNMRVLVTRFVASTVFLHLGEELRARGLKDVILLEDGLPGIVRTMREDRSCDKPTIAIVDVCNETLGDIQTPSDLLYTPIVETKLSLMAAKSLIPPWRTSITTEEASSLPIAYYSEIRMGELIDATFAQHPLSNIVLKTSNSQQIIEAVNEGRAVSFCDSFTSFCRKKKGEDTFFVDIENAAPFSFGFLQLKDKKPSDEERLYRERFEACIKTVNALYFEQSNHGKGA